MEIIVQENMQKLETFFIIKMWCKIKNNKNCGNHPSYDNTPLLFKLTVNR